MTSDSPDRAARWSPLDRPSSAGRGVPADRRLRADFLPVAGLLAVVGVLASACAGGTDDGSATRGEVGADAGRTAADASAGSPPAGCPADTARARERFWIGRLEGAEEHLFGDVTSVAADDVGRIYVADRIGSSVRAFGPVGRFLAWIATEGEGPGEVRWPTDLLFGPDGEPYGRDRHRVTVLVPSEPGGPADSVRATWPAPPLATSRTERSRLDGEGRFLYPHELHPREGPSRYFYLAQSRTGEVEDTVPVPAYEGLGRSRRAHYMISAGTGRMVQGLSAAPFEPKPTWSLIPRSTVLGGDGDEYVLVETDGRGDTVRRMGTPGAGRRWVPEGERRDSLEALEARIDSLPVRLSKVQGVSPADRDREMPRSLPAYTDVQVDGAGRAWVRRWPPTGGAGRTYFDVLGPEGACLGVVVLPEDVASRPPPFFGPDRILGVVEDPVTEVERVVVFSYRLVGEAR